MSNYRPAEPFNVPMFIFIPEIKTVKGSRKKVYPENGELIFCSFKSFGGTEITSNDTLVIEDTAQVETWYRPDIKADCKLKDESGEEYEILGTPENVNMRSQTLKFKVRSIRSGA